MDLKSYFTPLIKWWWLILAAAGIAAISTLVATIGQPPVYEARTTLLIGQSINNPNPSSSQFSLEQQLATIYADMGTREPIRKATMEALGLNRLPKYAVRALPNSQLVEITVSDTSPARAQAVAAELANQLIRRTPTSAQPEDQERQNFVNEELARLQEDITATQGEIEQLKIQLGGLRGAQEIADTQREIGALENKLRSLQANFASLLANTQKGAINTLAIIEPAELPTRPTGPNSIFSVLLAAVLGGCVAAAGAYLIEMLDQRVKNSEEVTQLLEWPPLAEIEQIPVESNPSTYVNDQPFSFIADSFRTLRTNLELAGVGQTIKTLLVTSSAVSEGKSMVALNLAFILAKAGKRVVLVDADFHRSELTIRNPKGLSDLLLDGVPAAEYLVPAYEDQLSILPTGENPLKATELLSSPHMTRILNDLKEFADVVIVDGPPIFVSDGLVLAARVDGVLIVVRSGESPREAITQMRAQLQRAHVNVIGIVINGVPTKSAYYKRYYAQAMVGHPPSNGRDVKNGRHKLGGQPDDPERTSGDGEASETEV